MTLTPKGSCQSFNLTICGNKTKFGQHCRHHSNAFLWLNEKRGVRGKVKWQKNEKKQVTPWFK
jgi:hypothetical protein